MIKNRISLFIATFLIIGFFFLALPEKGLGQTGCCIEPTNGGEACLGCAQTALDCGSVSTQSFCVSQGGEFEVDRTCGNTGLGAGVQCLILVGDLEGCCVIEPGVCVVDQEVDCLDTQSGELWVFDEVPTLSLCDNVPQCAAPAVVSAIPTLSQWGLMAMAGVLGIVGFMVIRRRKVTA